MSKPALVYTAGPNTHIMVQQQRLPRHCQGGVLVCLSTPVYAGMILYQMYLGIVREGAGMRLALAARGRGACAGGPLDVLNRRPPKRLLPVCVRRVCLGVRAARLQQVVITLFRQLKWKALQSMSCS